MQAKYNEKDIPSPQTYGDQRSFEDFLLKARKKNGEKLAERTIETYLSIYKKCDFPENIIDYMNFIIKRNNNMSVYSTFRLYLIYLGYDKKDIKYKLNTPDKIASALTSKQILSKMVLSRNELKRLIKETKEDKMKLIYCLLYDTACRREELCKFKYGHLTKIEGKKAKASLLTQGKGGINRTTYINSYTYNLLKKYSKGKAKRGNYIIDFKNKDGQPLKHKPKKITTIVSKHSKKILDRTVNPHMLRHTKATHMADQGASPLDIKEYLGHRDIKTSMMYIHVSSFLGERAFNKYSEDLF